MRTSEFRNYLFGKADICQISKMFQSLFGDYSKKCGDNHLVSALFISIIII